MPGVSLPLNFEVRAGFNGDVSFEAAEPPALPFVLTADYRNLRSLANELIFFFATDAESIASDFLHTTS